MVSVPLLTPLIISPPLRDGGRRHFSLLHGKVAAAVAVAAHESTAIPAVQGVQRRRRGQVLVRLELEDAGPVEQVQQDEEVDGGEEDADQGAGHHVHRVVLVVGDARQADVEGQGEDAKLEEGAQDLETAKQHADLETRIVTHS